MISTFGYTRNYYESLTEHELKKFVLEPGIKSLIYAKPTKKIQGGIWVPLDLEGEFTKETFTPVF